MTRGNWLYTALLAAGVAGIVGYAVVQRLGNGTEPVVQASSASSVWGRTRADSPAATSAAGPQDGSAAASTDSISKWAADAVGQDASSRAAAIAALAGAPQARAVPVLERVLNGGTLPDRQLSLRSLSSLALQQGDANNRIRDILRQAIYHQDTDEVVQGAQAALDEVEAALSQNAPAVARVGQARGDADSSTP